MTSQEKEALKYELKLESKMAWDKAEKLARNPVVRFVAGFIAADWYLSKRGR